MGTDGYQDFWFVNQEDGPVDVWLNTTSCKCSHVVVYLAPSGLVELLQRRGSVGQPGGRVHAGPVDAGLGNALATNMDREIAQLRDKTEGTTLDPKDKNAMLGCWLGPSAGCGWRGRASARGEPHRC